MAEQPVIQFLSEWDKHKADWFVGQKLLIEEFYLFGMKELKK